MPTEEQKRQAARLVADRMSERRWDERKLAGEAEIDPDTVKDFLSLKRWPQDTKRHAMEDALELPRNAIKEAASELYVPPSRRTSVADDEVEAAIYRSRLTKSNQLRLASVYYEMLESQRRTDSDAIAN